MHEIKGNKTVAETISKINLRINICKRKINHRDDPEGCCGEGGGFMSMYGKTNKVL